MSKKGWGIINVIVLTVILSIVFMLCSFNKSKDYEIEHIQKELDYVMDKSKEIAKRNEELLKLNAEQEKIVNELKEDVKYMSEDFNKIKVNTESTKVLLDSVDNSATNSANIISALKQNNKIFRDYFNSISSILEEVEKEKNND